MDVWHVVVGENSWCEHPVHPNKLLEVTRACIASKVQATCSHGSYISAAKFVELLKRHGVEAETAPGPCPAYGRDDNIL